MAAISDFAYRVRHIIYMFEWNQIKVIKDEEGNKTYDYAKFAEFKTSGLSVIKTIYGVTDQYYVEFLNNCKENNEESLLTGIGILKAILVELENGYLGATFKSLISAEFFTDFMDMADHLLQEGYKDAAAVMIGSVLEEHLRQLARKHSIDLEYTTPQGKTITKKADSLNNDLGAKEIYTLGEKKHVTGWLDTRNNAAHAHYDKYDLATIKHMYEGIQLFMARNSL